MNPVIANPIEFMDIEPREVWEYIQPKRGDHIRVQRSSLYSHHGVYISDEEVIHFTGTDDDSVLDWSQCEVICTDIAEFLRGGTAEVKIYSDDELTDLYPVEHIAAYARACLGDKDYNLIFNNCEHFANVCTLGRFRSIQVEQVLRGRLPLEEDKDMGFFSSIGGILKGIFGGGSGGSRSTSSTTYEPDKVKVAEIEADTKLRLAGMENDRIELMKQARFDILQYETESRITLERAKAQGLTVMAQTIVAMQGKLNEIAEKRLLIIEKGSLQVIREIETFYDELGTKIQEDDDRYNTQKLPELLAILEKYETGTPAHSLYMKRIEEDIAMQSKHVTQQLDALLHRQTQIIDGFLASKERIIEQTGQITTGILETIQKQQLPELGTPVINSPEENRKTLPYSGRLALAENAED